MPPRSPPLPDPALVTKKVVPGDCGGCARALVARDAAEAAAHKIIASLIVVPPMDMKRPQRVHVCRDIGADGVDRGQTLARKRGFGGGRMTHSLPAPITAGVPVSPAFTDRGTAQHLDDARAGGRRGVIWQFVEREKAVRNDLAIGYWLGDLAKIHQHIDRTWSRRELRSLKNMPCRRGGAVGSILASSRSSRISASIRVSPGSTPPPGKCQ